DVAGARDETNLAFECILAALHHLLSVVDAAIAGGFRTNQRTAPAQALAGKNTNKLIAQTFVLAEEEADFASAHADVSGRHVGISTNVTLEFGHEALAEAHDFVIALALGVEVRSALAAAHGKSGQGVLEDLFKGEEFEDSEVDRGMEAQA